jgi:signal transduction histidine kinase
MTTTRDADGAGWQPTPATFEQLEHELRTPLATIRSISEILRDYPDISESERRRFLDAVLEEERRLSGTIDRVLRARHVARLLD